MNHPLLRTLIRLSLCVWLLAACTSAPTEPAAPPTELPTASEPTTTITATPWPTSTTVPAAPTSTASPVPTEVRPTATATVASALLPDPQEIAFTATDGQELDGLFYPADRMGAPVVVLIHWVRGDRGDWHEIAPWLQNRGLANSLTNPGGQAWWDPAWFPPLPEGASYNVFTVSLRGCRPYPGGCSAWDRQGWIADIQGTLDQAAKLEGVDATRIVAIGSSIGADGAANGCAWLNEKRPGVCRGALSLSPGDYLGIPYDTTVRQLSEADPAVAVWCLADEQEVEHCRAAGEYATYQVFEVPGGGHGNQLLSPGLVPLPMQLVLDFLEASLGQ
jgi:hypothetical protein